MSKRIEIAGHDYIGKSTLLHSLLPICQKKVLLAPSIIDFSNSLPKTLEERLNFYKTETTYRICEILIEAEYNRQKYMEKEFTKCDYILEDRGLFTLVSSCIARFIAKGNLYKTAREKVENIIQKYKPKYANLIILLDFGLDIKLTLEEINKRKLCRENQYLSSYDKLYLPFFIEILRNESKQFKNLININVFNKNVEQLKEELLQCII